MKRKKPHELIAANLLPGFILFCIIINPLFAQSPGSTPVNFTIAFIGDQGLGSNAQAVLNLILNEGADAVVHSGDYDYQDNPQAWENQINSILGANFPYFPSIGNHDKSKFRGGGGYQQFMEARMNRLGITWDGDLGVKSSFNFNGVFFLLTGPGTDGSGHDTYIRDKLLEDNSIWSISSWHRNMRKMQVGGKDDDTGWGVYEESKKGGAIIATAHEHSYSRTHLLSSMQYQTVASTSDTLTLTKDLPETTDDEGKSFAFVSGMGGKSIRSQQLSGPWWASIYTSTQGANYGALFGTFNYNGDPTLAHFYFKDIDNVIADEFYVISAVEEPPTALLEVKVFLEGPYGAAPNEMGSSLSAANLLPVSSPYAEDSRTISAIPPGVSDWILVELRNSSTGAAMLSKSALLRKDGRIVDDDGSTEQIVLDAFPGDYYIVVKHRNHLAIMSSTAVTLDKSISILYDFTTSQTQAFGTDPMAVLEADVYGMRAGDGNGDGAVNSLDRESTWHSQNGTPWNYTKCSDFNLDGGIDAQDLNFCWRPNDGSMTQVPVVTTAKIVLGIEERKNAVSAKK